MADAYKVDQLLDLSGEVCPYTFVNSKLALEGLNQGQVLEIILDNAESASNVPRSLKGEGHEILSLQKQNRSEFHIICRKA